jgi:hypothetical protein
MKEATQEEASFFFTKILKAVLRNLVIKLRHFSWQGGQIGRVTRWELHVRSRFKYGIPFILPCRYYSSNTPCSSSYNYCYQMDKGAKPRPFQIWESTCQRSNVKLFVWLDIGRALVQAVSRQLSLWLPVFEPWSEHARFVVHEVSLG